MKYFHELSIGDNLYTFVGKKFPSEKETTNLWIDIEKHTIVKVEQQLTSECTHIEGEEWPCKIYYYTLENGTKVKFVYFRGNPYNKFYSWCAGNITNSGEWWINFEELKESYLRAFEREINRLKTKINKLHDEINSTQETINNRSQNYNYIKQLSEC